MLTGKFMSREAAARAEKGSRYDRDTGAGKMYSDWYIKDNTFRALEVIDNAAVSLSVTSAHAAKLVALNAHLFAACGGFDVDGGRAAVVPAS